MLNVVKRYYGGGSTLEMWMDGWNWGHSSYKGIKWLWWVTIGGSTEGWVTFWGFWNSLGGIRFSYKKRGDWSIVMKCLVGSVSSDEKVLAADHVTQALQPYWSVNQLSQIKIARGIANPYLLRPCSYGSDKNWELCWNISFFIRCTLDQRGVIIESSNSFKVFSIQIWQEIQPMQLIRPFLTQF